jgi:F-type H+-transporting ATPase subunit b
MLNEKFYLAVAFAVFSLLIIRFVWPKIAKALDTKSKAIAEEILAAKDLKEKAEKLLAEAEKYHEESLDFSKKIIDDTKKEATKLAKESEKSLKTEIEKKTQAALSRIKIEEETAIRGIKTQIIESAVTDLTKDLSKISNDEHKNLISNASEKLEKAL